MIDENDEMTDSFKVDGDLKSSKAVLQAIINARKDFQDWNDTCDTIDGVYSLKGSGASILEPLGSSAWTDSKLDLFWASMEILKPAVYARAPIPAVAPLFKDSDPAKDTTAEVLERSTQAAFSITEINDVMKQVRDDVIFTNRGVPWVRYEDDGGAKNQRICIEHVDRTDFLHESCRYWKDVGWVARRVWMSKEEMKKRFKKHSGDAYKDAQCTQSRENNDAPDEKSRSYKAGVWEVWHKADGRVYWVAENVDVILDEDKPHLDLEGFFPCPKPAYGTLERRSLIPVPDWQRYAGHFAQINVLTGRIYVLLENVRLMGIIGGGGDIADAIEDMLRSGDDSIIVRVNSISDNLPIAWLPLGEVATAIQGLIAARGQLIEDFYQLSGISDIMRGATEENETLGAQQLKSQFGSVRIREKVEELQRVAADLVKISAEIIAEKFTQENILKLCQMNLPSDKDIDKRIKDIEKAAEGELTALAKKAEQAIAQQQAQPQEGQEQADPQQAQQGFQQAQQEILQKYGAMLDEAQNKVTIDSVMKLLRDDKTRCYTFEVESDSTIMTDEVQEKASRNEFMTQFMSTSTSLMQIAAMGEAGAELAGEFIKFSLAPYRVGRQLDGVIDRWVKSAPQYAAEQANQGQGVDESAQAIAQANLQIAQAEVQKAQAAVQKVQMDGQIAQFELQQKQADLENKATEEQQKFALEVEKTQGAIAETYAKIEKIYAEIEKMGIDSQIAVQREGREDYRTEADIVGREEDRAISQQNRSEDNQFREREMTNAEQQAQQKGDVNG